MVYSKQIEMRFAEIMHLSERLCELAKALRNLSENEIMQTICKNKACWNSECADILTGKEAKISAGIVFEAERIHTIAEEMGQQAKRMYQSELINSQLATVRIY